jgi:hypothetical protein
LPEDEPIKVGFVQARGNNALRQEVEPVMLRWGNEQATFETQTAKGDGPASLTP